MDYRTQGTCFYILYHDNGKDEDDTSTAIVVVIKSFYVAQDALDLTM